MRYLIQRTLRGDELAAGEALADLDCPVVPVNVSRVFLALLHEHLQITEARRLLSAVDHVLPVFADDRIAEVLFDVGPLEIKVTAIVLSVVVNREELARSAG